nr:uncharacterized protein LOC129046063 [Mirounga angustirostris]
MSRVTRVAWPSRSLACVVHECFGDEAGPCLVRPTGCWPGHPGSRCHRLLQHGCPRERGVVGSLPPRSSPRDEAGSHMARSPPLLDLGERAVPCSEDSEFLFGAQLSPFCSRMVCCVGHSLTSGEATGHRARPPGAGPVCCATAFGHQGHTQLEASRAGQGESPPRQMALSYLLKVEEEEGACPWGLCGPEGNEDPCWFVCSEPGSGRLPCPHGAVFWECGRCSVRRPSSSGLWFTKFGGQLRHSQGAGASDPQVLALPSCSAQSWGLLREVGSLYTEGSGSQRCPNLIVCPSGVAGGPAHRRPSWRPAHAVRVSPSSGAQGGSRVALGCDFALFPRVRLSYSIPCPEERPASVFGPDREPLAFPPWGWGGAVLPSPADTAPGTWGQTPGPLLLHWPYPHTSAAELDVILFPVLPACPCSTLSQTFSFISPSGSAPVHLH